jgi:hypothetical protein
MHAPGPVRLPVLHPVRTMPLFRGPAIVAQAGIADFEPEA